MKALARFVCLFLGCAAVWPWIDVVPALAQEPIPTRFQERSEVRIRQMEVTAWPAGDDPASCLDLAADDFLLLINGQPRQILAVDPSGDGVSGTGEGKPPPQAGSPAGRPGTGTVQDASPQTDTGRTPVGRAVGSSGPAGVATVSAAVGDEGSAGRASTPELPLKLVFYFDLWHLNRFVKECGALSQPLAFAWVRRMFQTSFLPGDGLMLASFDGRPRILTDWLDERAGALEALDQLKASPSLRLPYRGHYRHDSWERGWMDLFQALGATAGRKDLFYLGDDLAWDPPPGHLYKMVGRAQANQVVVHAVDLIWNCRLRKPLFDSRYSMPLNLGTLPFHTGGRLFAGLSVARAVSRLRQMQPCRFRLSFQGDVGDGRRRPPRVKVSLKRRGFRLAGPVSYQTAKGAPSRRQQERARKLFSPGP
ncbi:MAG: hypothetical protein ACE5ID_03890 [Acidobacteriota bacterium]